MNAINIKKSLYVGLIGFLGLAFVSIIPSASADMSGHQPRLFSITEVTKNSVVLPIKDTKFKNETVTAIVSIKNQSTGILVEKAFKVSLNDKGDGSIKVGNLKSVTDYTFKVRLMRMGESDSTGNSSSKDASTL